MCGRYVLISEAAEIARRLGTEIPGSVAPRYNIAPTQPVLVVRVGDDGAREAIHMRWGFLPSWMKKEKGRPLINARSETVLEKRTFSAAYKRRRCLVPADGFYEWRRAVVDGKERRQPHFFEPAGQLHDDKTVFAFAGIWETYLGDNGSEADTVAILTTAAGPSVRSLHHREPVVVDPSQYERWLFTDETISESLDDLVQSSGAGFWRTYPVSTKVNAARREGADLLQPIDDPGDAPTEKPGQQDLFD